MEKHADGAWWVTRRGKTIGVVDADSSLIAVLPRRKIGPDSAVKEAYLIAASPQLFEACCKIKAILENNLVVTREGFQIDCSEVKETLLDATLRASGYRKAPEEP